MTHPGYITVPNWDKFQHYKDRQPAWIKLHLNLLGNDTWLGLSPADRCLLITIWLEVAKHGQGRVIADSKHLMNLANVPFGPRSKNLQRLCNAGCIAITPTKLASAAASKNASPEEEREEEHPLTPASGGNGFHPDTTKRLTRKQRQLAEANQKRMGAVQRCRYLWHQGIEDGELPDALREHLEREYRHDPSIVTEAIGAA